MIELKAYLQNQVEKNLGDLKLLAPKVLSGAANKTAIEARILLAEKAHEQYSVQKKVAKFKKRMKLKKAKLTKPTAIINAKGRPIQMINFKVTPKNFNPKRKRVPKGKVLTANQMKELKTSNRKAFIVKFKNPGGEDKSHITLAQRRERIKSDVPKKKRFTRECEVLYSPSVPSMLASDKYVYGPLSVRIEKIFKEQLLLELQKVLND